MRSCTTIRILFLTALSLLQSLHSQTAQLAAESERAIVRSQEDLSKARTLMGNALEQRSLGHLKEAFQLASDSLALSPSGPAAAKNRKALIADYTSIALAYARRLISDGVFTDSVAEQNGITDANGRPVSAESVAKSVLDPSVNPGNRQALKLLSDLEQPGLLNKSVTPRFAAKREEVVRLLAEADGLAQSGRNNEAIRSYEAVLSLDPYNNAARKGMEAIHSSEIKYSDEAYNETRSRLLWQVEKSWERPPRKSKQGRSTESVGRQQDVRGTDEIVSKLNSIIIPKIDLSDSPISETIEYLKQKSREQDPAKKGVNIFLKLGTVDSNSLSNVTPQGSSQSIISSSLEPKITLSLNNVPLYVALDYIRRLAKLKIKIEPYAVSIVPISEQTDTLMERSYHVSPNFFPSVSSSSNYPQPGLQDNNIVNIPLLKTRVDPKKYFEDIGIDFTPPASISYRPSTGSLVVRNTVDYLDQIEALVDASKGGESRTQVEIQTKFLEINQNNLHELGFDWLLGPFSVGGGVYGNGGGVPNASSDVTYPFGNPMAGGYPMSPVGGLRSGNQAVSQNSVDSLLAGQVGSSATPAPGIFSIAGVFSEPQFQLVIRALNQKKGVDLMSAPKVTAKSGEEAVVKVIQEFIYPAQYDPPQIPQSVSNSGFIPPTVTPSFPRSFKTEPIGVVLMVKPTIENDGYTIDLDLEPKVTNFDGFINYGSPINAVGYQLTSSSLGVVQTPYLQTITTNTIDQPVFSVRDVKTSVIIWDGHTVSLGGLIREDVQKVQDKVPFLGDVPLAGRLFRSDIDQKIKKNLVIFVTPRILDADGQPRRGDDTDEYEVVKPLGLPRELPQPSISSPAVTGK